MLFRKEQVAARSAGISSCFASQELAQLIAEGLAYSWSEGFGDHWYQWSKHNVAPDFLYICSYTHMHGFRLLDNWWGVTASRSLDCPDVPEMVPASEQGETRVQTKVEAVIVNAKLSSGHLPAPFALLSVFRSSSSYVSLLILPQLTFLKANNFGAYRCSEKSFLKKYELSMSASLQPESHSGTDFPGHPELSQLNEVAAACEFQDCLQNQSKLSDNGTLGSPTIFIPRLDCLSHTRNQIKHLVAIVAVTALHCGSERSQVTCVKQLVPGYSKRRHLILFKIYRLYLLLWMLCLHKTAEAVTQQAEE
ncbi:hypothetical protein EK904_014121 [Melospiza melodia maxima]|nr:hypothetical protein EK904_014121 [Melospiza melodia maxima]